MSNLQANSRGAKQPPDNLGKPPRTPRRTTAVQIRLTESELGIIQRAAVRWAADSEPARPRRRSKSAAATPAPAGEQPRAPRRYTPVPRFLRAVALAVARQGAGATGPAAAGAEGRAQLDPVTALRHEVRRIGVLLNQSLKVIRGWRGAPGGEDRAQLVATIELGGRALAEILDRVQRQEAQ